MTSAIPTAGRILGIDYGTRRTGLAISDGRQRIASPAGILHTTGRPASDAQALLRWLERQPPVVGIVVGLPLNMDGTEGPQAALTRSFFTHLQQSLEASRASPRPRRPTVVRPAPEGPGAAPVGHRGPKPQGTTGPTIPVELWDERLTSFQAEEILRTAGLTPARRPSRRAPGPRRAAGPSPSRRTARRDTVAATLILQSYLDARRKPAGGP